MTGFSAGIAQEEQRRLPSPEVGGIESFPRSTIPPMRCDAVEVDVRPRTAGLACKFCGCTDDNACCDPNSNGPCRWISINPPICSACETKADLRDDEAAPQLILPGIAGFFTEQYCPASAMPALHAPIFVDECSGHCARCQEGFLL